MNIAHLDSLDVLDRGVGVDPDQVRAAAGAAAEADGVAPLSEAFLLALARPGRHLVAHDEVGLIAYAGIAEDGSSEAFVVPAQRRQGRGRALLQAVLADRPDARIWAHGDLPAAAALASTMNLRAVRELLVLARPLTSADAEPAPLPAGYRTRAFVPGRDENELLAVNAAAFADHPEQGSMDRGSLADRMGQPWFDPAGLLLAVGDDGAIAGFHWTKIDQGVGEVYVLGISPEHQGRGLAGPLTSVGLAHLAQRGMTEVELYVEGDNEPALATYRRAGFERSAIHVMYSPGPETHGVHPNREG